MEIARHLNLLEGHSNQMVQIQWNQRHEKLLSLDEDGLMIVWVQREGDFLKEMVNKSERQKITYASWSNNGQLIVIVLDKREVILGTVEGERLWSLKVGSDIEFLQWLENDQTLAMMDF